MIGERRAGRQGEKLKQVVAWTGRTEDLHEYMPGPDGKEFPAWSSPQSGGRTPASGRTGRRAQAPPGERSETWPSHRVGRIREARSSGEDPDISPPAPRRRVRSSSSWKRRRPAGFCHGTAGVVGGHAPISPRFTRRWVTREHSQRAPGGRHQPLERRPQRARHHKGRSHERPGEPEPRASARTGVGRPAGAPALREGGVAVVDHQALTDASARGPGDRPRRRTQPVTEIIPRSAPNPSAAARSGPAPPPPRRRQQREPAQKADTLPDSHQAPC